MSRQSIAEPVRAAADSYRTGTPLRLRWWWVVALDPGTAREIALDTTVLRAHPGPHDRPGTIDTIGPGRPRTGEALPAGWVEVRYGAGHSCNGTAVGFWERWHRFDPEAMAAAALDHWRAEAAEGVQ